ncbi:hypothetical protein [Paenibacillus sp. HJGM_3]|uniref:hypothetical protein n=1 Tax=Paenibacillus sp. HJGM_3 TaxID=3379816 RepID=UPI00385CDB62
MRKFSMFFVVCSILLALFFIGTTAQMTGGGKIWWGLSKESAHLYYLPCLGVAFLALLLYLKSDD